MFGTDTYGEVREPTRLPVHMMAGVVVMALFALIVLASAVFLVEGTEDAQAATVTSGQCGENIHFTLDSDGTLTISGTGNMYQYGTDEDSAPWYNYRESIKQLIVEEGVTSIGTYAFNGCSYMEMAYMPYIDRIGTETESTLGNSFNVTLSSGETKYFYFVPSTNGNVYVNSSSSYDTYGYLYDNYNNQLTYDDDSGSNNNFSYSYYVYAGEKYRIGVRFYSSDTSGSLTVNVSGVPVTIYNSQNYSPCFSECGSLRHVILPIDVTIYSHNAFSGCNNLSVYTLTKERGNQSEGYRDYMNLPWNRYLNNMEKIHIDEDVTTVENVLNMNILDYYIGNTITKSAQNLAGYSLIRLNGSVYRVSEQPTVSIDAVGAVVTCPDTLTANTKVTFNVGIADGYRQDSMLEISVYSEYGNIDFRKTGTDYSFTAPYCDVTIKVTGAVPETYGIFPHLGEGHSLSVFNGRSMP
ncbi:MAG: leucine-rich repeat protein, partial [archaeon]|nr:leucine-rich repeat protein [archaeon]